MERGNLLLFKSSDHLRVKSLSICDTNTSPDEPGRTEDEKQNECGERCPEIPDLNHFSFATWRTASAEANRAKKPTYAKASVGEGGEGGIRTPGPFTVNCFQDSRDRPLCHLSGDKGKISV